MPEPSPETAALSDDQLAAIWATHKDGRVVDLAAAEMAVREAQRVYAAVTGDWQSTRAIAAAVLGMHAKFVGDDDRERVLVCLSNLSDEGRIEHRLAPMTSFPERGEWRRDVA